MAEGDTIFRTARQIDRALAGRRVAASAPSPRGRAAGVERLDGVLLESCESRGKNLLLRFSGGLVLHSHLGMRGAWQTCRAGERWMRPRTRAWALLEADGVQAVQFDGSTLRVMTDAQLRRDPRIARLGPDLLDDDFRSAEVVGRIRSGDDGRELGELLLDQRLVAGIGNIFKSEACFAARVDPRRPAGELSDAQLTEVLDAARALMSASAQGQRRPFGVYRRGGRPCSVCGTTILSASQGDAARVSYWCPSCQQ